MQHTIQLAAHLAAAPAAIYDMYLDQRLHAEITGAPAAVEARVGARFSAFDGTLTGTILQLAPGRLIVQSWRSPAWAADDVDSTLILNLSAAGRGQTLVQLIQINVPTADFAGVSQGWELYYWAPWRQYLAKRATARPRKR
jgi:activator of HSP90 ATPase